MEWSLGVCVCVFARSFGVQAVAAWCAKYDENYDLNLDPVSPTSLLGRPCIARLTTLWRLASLRLQRLLLRKTCLEGRMRVVKWRRSIFSTTFRNVWVSKAWTRQCLRFQRRWFGIGDPVEQVVDVDVMISQIVEDVVEHADEVECFLQQFLEERC